MEAKIRKIVDFFDSELHCYPFPNSAKVTYLLNSKVLCQFDVEYFFEEDLKTVQEYAADLNASDKEKRDLLKWYLTGHTILSNPIDLCDERGLPMDFLSGVRTAEDLYIQEQEQYDRQARKDMMDYSDDMEDLLPF